ncbi:MAG: TOMM precursor leader peptide-binding protein [Proteobacteria bacterium]|nr:TOMM precursor leader peptide-binding protein [Pseudomonadota bacterium]
MTAARDDAWLDAHLAYAPHFSLYAQGADRLLLLSEERSFRLNGAIYQTMIPLLDGTLRGREVVERLAGVEPPEQLRGRIVRLLKSGYATLVVPGVDLKRQAYWSALGEVPAEVLAALRRTRLDVVGLGETQVSDARAAQSLGAGFADLGLTLVPEVEADIVLALVDDYLQPAARDFAQRQARDNRRWLPFKPGGNTSWLGPAIGGAGGACFTCFARRLLEHRSSDLIVATPGGSVRPARSWLPHTLSAAVGFAGIELARLARGADSRLMRGLLSWDPEQGQSTLHVTPRFDDCPSCGAPRGAVEPRPIRLAEALATRAAGTAWRSLSTREALARLDPCVSPITGIVDGTEAIEIAPGLHICNARQAFRVVIDPRANRHFGRPEGASGKGVTAEQARASCLAESVERYACAWTSTEPRRAARLADLGEQALHPHALLGFSDFQYDNRETLNKDAYHIDRIPQRFDAAETIDWSPAWSLRDDAPRWLPSRYVYFNYDGPGGRFCYADSNGTASGATLEEAMFHGLLELIERDGVAMWWYNRLRMPEIALDGIDENLVGAMRAHYGSLGRDLRLIDLTNDVGVPVIAALSVNRQGARPILGLGAHLDPRIAAVRALSELNQMLMFEGVPEGEHVEPHSMASAAVNFITTGAVDRQPYLLPAADSVRTIEALPQSFRGNSVVDGLRHIVDRLAAMGHDTIAFDYGRSDLPLACTRVVVPGLRHFWSRRGPGRLFDVPVRMGWLAKPLAEADLNPIGFFI